MMFLGLFMIVAVCLGLVVLFLSFFSKRHSLAKTTLTITGASLLAIPMAFSFFGRETDKKNEESRAGVYISTGEGRIDWITLESSGDFRLESDCSNYPITGKWIYHGGEFDVISFRSETLTHEQVWSSPEDLTIRMPSNFGCGKGEIKMNKTKN